MAASVPCRAQEVHPALKDARIRAITPFEEFEVRSLEMTMVTPFQGVVIVDDFVDAKASGFLRDPRASISWR